jgi:uncharacterized protein YjbI with pentapeptide repeats
MIRLAASDHGRLLYAWPPAWIPVLDVLASRPDLPGVAEALRVHVEPWLPRALGLDGVPGVWDGPEGEELRRTHSCLRFEPFPTAWCATALAHFLGRGDLSVLARWESLDDDTLDLAAHYVGADRRVRKRLGCALDGADAGRHAVAASLLHRLAPEVLRRRLVQRWARSAPLDLRYARLPEVDARDLVLCDLLLGHANLARADLRGARLEGLSAPRADFSRARLTGADLRHAYLSGASFDGADLEEVCLEGARLTGADFRGARLRGADLRKAELRRVRLRGADAQGACFDGAVLSGVELREFTFEGATFQRAVLVGVRLADLTLSGADFSHARLDDADLTGARLDGARLRRTSLRGACLAFVDLEGADLRGADFSYAAFHMGSSRSGLVSSPIASEGTRTGFYTDENEEQLFKSPEEIGKANLRGADLREARVEHADFYLVDLRDARYDAEAAEHFQRCGAILADKEA